MAIKYKVKRLSDGFYYVISSDGVLFLNSKSLTAVEAGYKADAQDLRLRLMALSASISQLSMEDPSMPYLKDTLLDLALTAGEGYLLANMSHYDRARADLMQVLCNMSE